MCQSLEPELALEPETHDLEVLSFETHTRACMHTHAHACKKYLMAHLNLARSMGMGMGPLAAGMALWIYDLLPWQFGLEIGASCTSLILLQLLLGLAILRCPQSVQQHEHKPEDAEELGHTGSKQMIFLGACYVLSALRGYCLAGTEVGTALLLEARYHWSRKEIGLIIGWVFIATVPARVGYLARKDRFSVVTWIRILSLSAIVGATILFSSTFLPHGMSLILADLIMFPALYLGEGLVRGLMMQSVRSHTSISSNTASFCALQLNNFSRGLAPWCARYTISTGKGQNLFAVGQLMCCCAFLCVFELGVQRGLKKA